MTVEYEPTPGAHPHLTVHVEVSELRAWQAAHPHAQILHTVPDPR